MGARRGGKRGRRSPPKSTPASPHVSTSDKDVYGKPKRKRRTSGDTNNGSGSILQLPKSRSRPSLSSSTTTSTPQIKPSTKRPPRSAKAFRKGRANKSSSLSKSPSREQSSAPFRSRRQISMSSPQRDLIGLSDLSRPSCSDRSPIKCVSQHQSHPPTHATLRNLYSFLSSLM